MSLGENGASLADIAAVANGGGGNGWGGNGYGWLFVLFLFAMCNGGFGNWGNGGGNGGVQASMQRGFDQQATQSGIAALQSQVGNGFADAAVARCSGDAAITAAVTNGQYATAQAITGAKDTLNSTLYANQLASNQQMNSLAMALQNCCCENRAATADLKYTVATEACADRAAVSNGVRDIIANQTANTNAIIQSNERGFQAVQDKLCQMEIDNLKSENERLRTQLNMAGLAASQTSQTSQLQAGNLMQTQQILDAIRNLTAAVTGNNGCGCAAAC